MKQSKTGLMTSVIAAFMVCFILSGCNTVEGVGKDIEKSATWTKDQISK